MKIALIFAALGAVMATPVLAADDGAFLTEAMKGDASEVSLGKLAEARGGSDNVRAYGAMLVHDHGAHHRKVAALARSMHSPTTMALSDEGAQARTMMLGLHGAQFDAAFKQHMVADHKEDIGKYEAEVQSAQSPRVRALAKATLPTLHKHLAAAEAL